MFFFNFYIVPSNINSNSNINIKNKTIKERYVKIKKDVDSSLRLRLPDPLSGALRVLGELPRTRVDDGLYKSINQSAGQKKNCIPVATWYDMAWVGWYVSMVEVSLQTENMMTYL
jgi:hypothetical protein